VRADAVRPEQSGDFDPLGFTPSCHHEGLTTYASATFSRPLSRTLAGAHAAAFQTVSADNHPIHYDVEYARRHGILLP